MKRDLGLEAVLVNQYAALAAVLDERGLRVWAAAAARVIGFGGDSLVSAATGLARQTIREGRRELENGVKVTGRVRQAGAGRPGIQKREPEVKAALERLVDPLTRGDRRSPLRWTCKSRAKLAATLSKAGWTISSTTVGRLLHELGYSLQSVRKRREGASHPDRNAQFESINATAERFLQHQQPVISVATKKKQLVGEFSNGGGNGSRAGPRSWRWCTTSRPMPAAKPSRMGLRYGTQRSLRQCRSRSRYAGLRGRLDPAVVANDGPTPLPAGQGIIHHG